jgi:hypothetical protein
MQFASYLPATTYPKITAAAGGFQNVPAMIPVDEAVVTSAP